MNLGKHTVKVSPFRTASSAAVSFGAPKAPGSTFSLSKKSRQELVFLLGLQGNAG